MQWWSKRQSDSGDVKPKNILTQKTYEQIDDLIGALSDSRWQVRLNAIQQLSEHPTVDAIPSLTN